MEGECEYNLIHTSNSVFCDPMEYFEEEQKRQIDDKADIKVIPEDGQCQTRIHDGKPAVTMEKPYSLIDMFDFQRSVCQGRLPELSEEEGNEHLRQENKHGEHCEEEKEDVGRAAGEHHQRRKQQP